MSDPIAIPEEITPSGTPAAAAIAASPTTSLPSNLGAALPTTQAPTAGQRGDAARAASEKAPGLLEGLDLAVQDTPTATVWNGIFGARLAPDPNFKLDEPTLKTLTEGLPRETWDALGAARSLAEAQSIRGHIKETLERREKLAAMGVTGAALNLAVNIIDPTALVAGWATGGVGATANMGRAGRALVGAMAGAGVEGGLAAWTASNDATASTRDVLIAAGLGGIAGGLGGFFSRSGGAAQMDAADEAAARLSSAAVLRNLEEAGVPLSRTGQSTKAHLLATTAQLEAEGAEMFGSSTAGAAQRPGVTPLSQAADDRAYAAAERLDGATSVGGRARFDMVGQSLQSEHPLIKETAMNLGEESVGLTKGATTFSASEDANLTHRVWLRDMYAGGVSEAERAWVKQNGTGWVSKRADTERFYEEVSRAVRRPPGAYTNDPHINRAADKLRQSFAKIRDEAEAAGVRGFDQFGPNDTYLMRVWRLDRIMAARAQYGEAAINRMFANAALGGSAGNLSPQDAQRLGRAFQRALVSRSVGAEVGATIQGTSREGLEAAMRATGVTDDLIEQVLGRMDDPSSGNPSRAKHRVSFDETHVEQTFAADGVTRVDLRMEDFMENNAAALFAHYSRQVAGLSALAKKGIRSEADWQRVINDIRQTAPEYSPKLAANQADLDKAIDKLETLRKSVLGIPLSPNSRANQILRVLRDFNFVRMMGQVGFSQIAEFGAAASHVGFRNMLSYVPEAFSVIKRAKSGRLPNQFMEEIESHWALGGERYLERMAAQYDREDGFLAMGQVSKGLKHLTDIVSDVSGMAPITSFQRRLATAAAINRMTKMAQKGRWPNESQMRSLGLDEPMMRRVFAELNTNAARVNGVFGRKVTTLGFDNWTDVEAREAFTHAVYRWSRKAVQENDIGNLSQWMTTPMGRMLGQFKTFVMVAHQKQLLAGLYHMDQKVLTGWAIGMFLGSMTYIGQTNLNAFGRGDTDKHLDRMLTPEKIALAGFNRLGAAALVPTMVDSALLPFLGFDGLFTDARSSGLGADIISGNPTVRMFADVGNVVGGAVQTVVDPEYKASKADVKATFSVLPLGNAIGIRNISNLMAADLPYKSTNH
jgi:hypothetical protein